MTVAEAALVALLTFLSRAVPRVLRKDTVSSDTYYHLLAGSRIRENKFRLPKRLRGLSFPGPYDYPPLFHYLIALVPERYQQATDKYLAAIVDVCYVTSFFVFCVHVYSSADGSAAASSEAIPLLVATLLSLSPALLYVGRGPRAFNANPRIFAELLFAIGMYGTYLSYVEGSTAGLVTAIGSFAFLLLASKFGAQVIVFFFPPLALLLQSVELIAIPVAAFAAAVVMSRGHYLAIARGHLGHLCLFGQLGTERQGPFGKKSEWREFFRLLRSPGKQSLYQLFFINSISTALLRNPTLIVVFAYWRDIAQTAGTHFLFAWVEVSVVVFALISLRRMLFLGEAERYLSFSIPAQFLLLGLLVVKSDAWLIVGLAGWILVFSAANVLIYLMSARRSRQTQAEVDELYSYLRQSDVDLHIMPLGEAPFSLAYKSGKSVFYPCGNFGIWTTTPGEYLAMFGDQWRGEAGSFLATLERFGVNAILINKAAIKDYAKLAAHGSTGFENGRYLLLFPGRS
jgi:hypothetical protein